MGAGATQKTSTLPDKQGFGPRPGDGTPVVHPGDFDRMKDIMDLAKPRDGVDGKGASRNPKGDGNPLDNVKTTINPGDGRNTTSRTGLASEGDPAPIPYPSTTPSSETKIPQSHGDEAGTVKGVASGSQADRPVAPSIVGTEGKPTQPIPVAPDRSTPNPDSDTGDGHGPKAIQDTRTPIGPQQVEQARKRQVTLPGDDQGGPREKVTVDPKEAVTWGVKRGTDGRIDPGPSDGTTDRVAPGPMEKVSPGSHKGEAPGPRGPDGTVGPDKSTPPSRGGNTPDNPTASTGTGSTTGTGDLPRANQ